MLSGQLRQAVLDATDENVFLAHFAHDLAPRDAANVPGAHASHRTAPVASTVMEWPWFEELLWFEDLFGLSSCSLVVDFPSSHKVQRGIPGKDANEPEGQGEQSVAAFSEKLPAEQFWQNVLPMSS